MRVLDAAEKPKTGLVAHRTRVRIPRTELAPIEALDDNVFSRVVQVVGRLHQGVVHRRHHLHLQVKSVSKRELLQRLKNLVGELAAESDAVFETLYLVSIGPPKAMARYSLALFLGQHHHVLPRFCFLLLLGGLEDEARLKGRLEELRWHQNWMNRIALQRHEALLLLQFNHFQSGGQFLGLVRAVAILDEL